jgi:hypothetical protein
MRCNMIRETFNPLLRVLLSISERKKRKTASRQSLQNPIKLIRRPFPRRYAFRKASRSALIVAASVVGMPCGKSL